MNAITTVTARAYEHRDEAAKEADKAIQWQEATARATNDNARRQCYNEARYAATGAISHSAGAARAADEAEEAGDAEEGRLARKAATEADRHATRADEAAGHAYDLAYEGLWDE